MNEEMCAHSDLKPPCKRSARLGHIFCESCRVESGGYIRYTFTTRLRDLAGTANSTTALKEQQHD